MDSELISTIGCVVGIIGELIAFVGLLSKKNEGTGNFTIPILNSLSQKFYAYVFSSATWVLLVLVWYLGFHPYGMSLLDRESNQLIAIMLSFPVIVAFCFSIKHLFGQSKN
jgi:cytochrome b subunit of formate dehydrogenase